MCSFSPRPTYFVTLIPCWWTCIYTKIKKCIGLHCHEVVALDIISTKKHFRFKDRLRPFSSHDKSRFSFIILRKIKHPCFLIFYVWFSDRNGMCVCWLCFFGHSWTTWCHSSQYKWRLFAHHHFFSCFFHVWIMFHQFIKDWILVLLMLGMTWGMWKSFICETIPNGFFNNVRKVDYYIGLCIQELDLR